MPSDQNYITKLVTDKKYSQPYLIKPMQALGYKSNVVGVCLGYSMMAIQAFLSADIKTFNERIDYLVAEHNDILANCQILQKKLASKIPFSQLYFTADEKKIIALKGFFEGIEIYFQAEHYEEIFGEKLRQKHTVETSHWMNTPAIESEGGMVALKGWIGAYTQSQFKNYIFALDMVAKKHNQDLAIMINGHNHSVALTWQAGKWRIYDSDNLLYGEFEINILAAKLFEIFVYMQVGEVEVTPEVVAASCVIVSTQLFSTAQRKVLSEKYCELLAENKLFQRLHQVSPQSIALKSVDLETLAIAAAQQEYFEIFDQIEASGGDVDSLNLNGWSARKFKTAHTSPPVKDESLEDMKESERIYIFIADLAKNIKIQLQKRNYRVIDVYNALSDKDELKLTMLTMTAIGFLNAWFVDSDDLGIVQHMSPADQDAFFDKLGVARLLELVKSFEDVIQIFKLLNPKTKKTFSESISTNKKILGLIETTFQLMRLSRSMPDDMLQMFFTNISDEILLGLTRSTHDFLVILKLLPASRKQNYFNKAEKKLNAFYAYNENTSTYTKNINKFKKDFKKVPASQVDSFLAKIIDGETQTLVDEGKNIVDILKENSGFLIMLHHLLQGRYTDLLLRRIDLFNIFAMIDLGDSKYVMENIDREILIRLFNTPLEFARTFKFDKAFAPTCLQRVGSEFLLKTARQDISFLPDLMINLKEPELRIIINDFTDKELSIAIKEAQHFALIYYGTTLIPGRSAAFLAEFTLEKVLTLVETQYDLIFIFKVLPDENKLSLLKLMPEETFSNLLILDEDFFRAIKECSIPVRNAIFGKLSNAVLIQRAGKTSSILQFIEYLPSQRVGGFLDDVLIAVRDGILDDDKKILPILIERESDSSQFKVKSEKEIINQFILLINYVQCQFIAKSGGINSNSLFSQDMKINIHQLTTVMKDLENTDCLRSAISMLSDFFNSLLADENVEAFTKLLLELFSSLCILTDNQWKSFKSFTPSEETAGELELDVKTLAVDIISQLDRLPTLFTRSQTLSLSM